MSDQTENISDQGLDHKSGVPPTQTKRKRATVQDVIVLVSKVPSWELGDVIAVTGAILMQYGELLRRRERTRRGYEGRER